MSRRLTDRWQEPGAAKALKRIIRALEKGGKFDGNFSPFGQFGSRWDMRYAPIRAQNLVRRMIVKTVIEDVDFSGADFTNARIEKSGFQNVCFDAADMGGVIQSGNRHLECSFFKTHFIQGGIGYQGTQFQRCRFERAKFTRVSCGCGEFDDCEFIDCDLRGMDFHASSFVRCRFVGRVEDVWFHGTYHRPEEAKMFGKARRFNRMEQVDFRDASLWKLGFSDGVDLSTVLMPTEGRYVRFDHWFERLTCLFTAIQTWPDQDAETGRRFCEVAGYHGRSQEWIILNLDEQEEWMSGKVDRIIETLSNCPVGPANSSVEAQREAGAARQAFMQWLDLKDQELLTGMRGISEE